MATPTAAVRAASSDTFSPAIITPLIDKVHGFFGLKMAFFVAGAAACLRSFYKAYQFSTHSAFGLSDDFKYVKCSALLLEADEKQETENIHPMLQQCEALLVTITDKQLSSKQETILAKLVELYAKIDPAHAYLLAQQLNDSDNLFNAAQTIQKQCPDFNKTKLLSLYRKANHAASDNEKRSNIKKPLLEWINWSLKLAKAYHSVGGSNSCIIAHELAFKVTNPLDKMRAFCEIAKCAYEIENKEYPNLSIYSAKELLSQIPKEDLIEARLVLADAYLCLRNIGEMDQELKQVDIFIKVPSTNYKHIYAFVKIISKIHENNMEKSDFYNSKVEDYINIANTQISSLDVKTQLEALINVESLYQQALVGHTPEKINWEPQNKILFNKIASLPENSEEEMNSKIDLFIRLSSFENESQVKSNIIVELIKLHYKCPAQSLGPWDQARLGERIVALYNEMGLELESTPFLQLQINKIATQENTEDLKKITNLVFYGSKYTCSKDQRHYALKIAEQLLPQGNSNSDRNLALAQIAEGYLQVDREKSLAIMADLEDRQAKNYKALGFITAIATASIYFYPTVAPVLFLGAGVLRLYPSAISAVY